MVRTALIRKFPAFAAAVCAGAVCAGTGALPASAGTTILPDGGVRYDYGRRPLPVLTCKPQFVCDIVLDSGESILNMAIGDSGHWVIASGKSGSGSTTPNVFVKPTQINVETNLVITTTKRVYNVTSRSAAAAPHPQISFFFADEAAAAKAAIAQHERDAISSVLAGAPAVGPDQADTKYKVTGEPSLMPAKVYNDGVRTFIEWKSLPPELPEVVAIAKDGSATPVNFRVVGSKYIVDDVATSFDLVVAAVNERHGRPEQRASIRHE
jgi:type IV secretion system protein VirB9